jgi:hypothetical protein
VNWPVARLAVATALFALGACGGGPRTAGADRPFAPRADPGLVAATERAFARMAREEGTWTAFRHYATSDAVWPSPGFQLVQQSLAGAADPAEAIVWGPEQVWSSCDGSFAVSTGGALYPDGSRTRFFTVWQRQEDGEYRFVLDQGLPDDGAQIEPDMIAASAAECAPGMLGERPRRPAPVRRGEAWGSGRSDDGTLEWQTVLAADCSRVVTVRARRQGELAEVFRREAPPPALPAGQAAPTCG